MNRLGHWLRITRRFDSIIAELRQMILAAEAWNGFEHNQQYTPLDVEWERVMLADKIHERESFLEKNPRPE